MRIMIKGGVWKNTEDEILKAAVMKYGKNQWARISSLLVRKSAKQCKARWYEWLDPSIKKTEWTGEEDEKLLHLAKLMPTQWRTIAPIVGRTPAQCLERYEKLLDAACAKEGEYEAPDDPRRLRPGEIDPNPESKPARPDPVDMDEDEKDMLSEARARLANTRGKKAKRKAREKQLEEARRLASLQKRRELKAAGIELNRYRKKQNRRIDYNAEIPFERKPPPGFFDVTHEERPPPDPQYINVEMGELEGKRRVDIEAQLRKQDMARNKIVERNDAPSSVLQINRLNDPEAVRKRSKLMLPAPQVSDRELEEIAKMGYASDMVNGEVGEEGSTATRALLGNYEQTPRERMGPLRTPQRTPSGRGDAIMLEAENLARMRDTQTPLFGGENPELHPSDFSGVTPKRAVAQTPNPIATPLRTPGTGIGATPHGMTPALAGPYGATPRATPIRDELHINEGLETPSESAREEKQRQAELKRNLRAGLGSLPEPKNLYHIVIPEVPEEEDGTGEAIEDDMSDVLARQRAEQAAREAELLKKRSKVLQRDLPRPLREDIEVLAASLRRGDEANAKPMTLLEQADEDLKAEMVALLLHDAARYPLEEPGDKKKGSSRGANGRPAGEVPPIEDFELDELEEAAALLEEEVEILRTAMGHEDATLENYEEQMEPCTEDMAFFPTRNAYGLASVATTSDKLAELQYDFEKVKQQMEAENKKAIKLEQKLKILTAGYQVRAENLWRTVEATYKEAVTLGTELECFKALHRQEQMAAPRRIEAAQEDVKSQMERERALQLRYENLLVEQDNLRRTIADHDAATKAAAERAREEAEEKAKTEAEEKARVEAEEKARAVAEDKARAEAEEKAREEAVVLAKKKAEEEEVSLREAEPMDGVVEVAGKLGSEPEPTAKPPAEQQPVAMEDGSISDSRELPTKQEEEDSPVEVGPPPPPA